jgi:NitT/TauT family transport system permease protein
VGACRRLTGVKEYLLPPPSKVWTGILEAPRDRRRRRLGDDAGNSRGLCARGRVSIPLALAVAYSRFMEQAVYPVIVFLQIIPKIAIAPLFIIWFGFGFMPKLLLVFLLSFFPIVVSSIAGFKERGSRHHGLRAYDRCVRIRHVPEDSAAAGAASHFHGLKVGAALAATAAVVAEFVASDRGLGYLLLQYNGQLDTPMVFAIIVILSLIGSSCTTRWSRGEDRHTVARVAAGHCERRNALTYFKMEES